MTNACSPSTGGRDGTFSGTTRACTPAIIPPTAPPRSRRSSVCAPTAPAYLVFPQVALWWLDHYAGLREHLDRHGRVVVRDDRTAVIYALDRSESRPMSTCSPVATLRTLRRFNRWFDGFTPDSESGRAPLSVNVSGYLRDESGWGAAARGYVRALRRLGVPTRLDGLLRADVEPFRRSDPRGRETPSPTGTST